MRREGSPSRIVASHPESDPRGLGYAAIVISDMFEIGTSMDPTTSKLLERQRQIGSKATLSTEESAELDVINDSLDRLGFRFNNPDEEYARYLRLRHQALLADFGIGDDEAFAARAAAMSSSERERLAARLIGEMAASEPKPGGPD